MTFFESPDLGAPPRRRPRRGRRGVAVGVALALVLAAAAAGVILAYRSANDGPPSFLEMPPSIVAPEPIPDLAPELAALADRMHLTAEGREVFARTHPRYVDADEVSELCGADAHESAGSSPAGCFTGFRQSRAQDRIVIYRPDDERLAESLVTVGAHELLHAVYARLEPAERARVDELIAAETARVPVDDPVHAQIEASMDGKEASRATEQFAYLGSQIWPEGGYAAELETIYARTFVDRKALVETHHRAVAVLDGVLAAVEKAWSDVAAAEGVNAQTRAQLEADTRGYSATLETYNEDVEEFNATSPEERKRWTVTLTPSKGEPMTMSWEESLTYRGAELDRFKSDLDARRQSLEAAEAAAARLRTDTEALRDDAMTLLRDADPGKKRQG